jgi:hypothetical protein
MLGGPWAVPKKTELFNGVPCMAKSVALGYFFRAFLVYSVCISFP